MLWPTAPQARTDQRVGIVHGIVARAGCALRSAHGQTPARLRPNPPTPPRHSRHPSSCLLRRSTWRPRSEAVPELSFFRRSFLTGHSVVCSVAQQPQRVSNSQCSQGSHVRLSRSCLPKLSEHKTLHPNSFTRLAKLWATQNLILVNRIIQFPCNIRSSESRTFCR